MSSWGSELAEQAFAEAIERALGERIRGDEQFTARAWGSMANVTWKHPIHGEDGLTFRGAGMVLADIRGSGSYMDWYMSSADGVVDPEFKDAMALEGWLPSKDGQ